VASVSASAVTCRLSPASVSSPSMRSSSRTVCGLSSDHDGADGRASAALQLGDLVGGPVGLGHRRPDAFQGVPGDTLAGWFTTLDTVPAETSASVATSRTVTRRRANPLSDPYGARGFADMC
jgi:hypothetical protein